MREVKTISSTKLKAVHIQTIVTLEKLVDNVYVQSFVGHATCVGGDKFSKDKGRTAAMENMKESFEKSEQYKQLKKPMGACL